MRVLRHSPTRATALLAAFLAVLAPIERAALATETGLSCKDVCSGATSDVESPSQAVIDKYCAVPEDSGLSADEKTQAEKDCKDGLASAWPTVYPQCGAMEIAGQSFPVQYTFASLYAAMAITCAVAAACCGTECEAVTSGFCTFGGLALTGGELATLLIMSAINHEKVKEVLQGNQWTSSLAGAAPAVLKGVGALAKSAKGGSGSGSGSSSGSSSGSGGGSSSSSSSPNKNNKACYLSTILSMVTYGGTAVAKFSAAGSNRKTEESSCKAIEENFSESFDYTRYITPGTAAGTSSGMVAGGSTSQASGSTSKKSGSGSGYDGPTTSELVSNPAAFSNAATAAMGGDGSLRKLNELDDLSRVPDILKKSGVDLTAATAALKSGGTSAMFDSVAKDMGITPTEDQRAALGQLSRLMEADARAFAASITPKLSTGKAGGKTTSAAGGFGFGFGARGLTAPVGGMKFDPAKPSQPQGFETTDIWHEADPRSIFQIVSQRVSRSRERVEQFEWDSPLNRALNGLPRKDEGTPPKLAPVPPTDAGGPGHP